MTESNYESGGNEGKGRRHVPVDELPHWKRMHHSWLFRVGVAMVSVAIAIYVLSDNLALVPRGAPQPALSDTGGSGTGGK